MYGNLDPRKQENWGPSVRYERTYLTPSSRLPGQLVTDFPVGKSRGGGKGPIVTAVKFVNVGTTSSVQVGREEFFETIPRTGAAEISFGEGFPLHICDDFRIIWTSTGADSVHKVLAIVTVVNFGE